MKKTFCAIVAAAALAGCGGGDPGSPGDLSLMLDYFPNADHAGIYAAQGGGHFADAGLEVTIRQPSDPAAPIRQVAAGRVDLAISYEPEVRRARDEGLPVTSIAAIVGEPLTSLISLPEGGVETPADLEGKTVGTAGIDYQSAFLEAILEAAEVDPVSVRERNLGFNLVPGLLTEKADAVLGAFWNYEGTDLELRGRNPRVIRIEEAGVPSYDELVLVANSDRLEEDPEPLRKFVAALAEGTADLAADPEAAVEPLLEANPDLDPELQRAVVEKTLPLFLPPEGRPYGWQIPAEREAFADFMLKAGLLENEADGASYTNDLLPEGGAADS
ncbi:MAG: ABC transporter substrate-binding protein [Thermoleophilaceae bacterium]|nr:ABC transporter substrate-binding protein [Thermoleophilaceae bacterium]